MALKQLKDIKFPDYPKMIEVRVLKKWYTRGNTQQYSYLLVDVNGDAIEAVARSSDERELDDKIQLQHCYQVTNYTTIKGRDYTTIVPHDASIRITANTVFQLVTNDRIPPHYFNFVLFDELPNGLRRGSPLSDFIGRAEAVTDMIPTYEKKTKKTIHLRRVTISDERQNTLEVTLWEEKGRRVDKTSTLHQIVAVTATFVSEYLQNARLTSTNATSFHVNPLIPELEGLKENCLQLNSLCGFSCHSY